jgi:hypothetical protein
MVCVGDPFVVLSVILLLPNETMCPPLPANKPVPFFTTVTLVMLIVALDPTELIPLSALPDTMELSRFMTEAFPV